MLLKIHHKRAARYFLVGMTPLQIAERLKPFTPKLIKQWRSDLDFKAYMARLEKQYVELLDKDIEHLRRSATARLHEIIDRPYQSKNFNMGHFEWAINKIFQITVLREKTLNVNQQLDINEPRAASTPEQKAALKHLLQVSPDPDRYGASLKQGEA